MSEILPPQDNSDNDIDAKNVEAALAAALAKPHNPIEDAHQEARIAEDFLNEYFESMEAGEEDSDEVSGTVAETISRLDQHCNHMNADVIVTGLVKSRSLNHRLIEDDPKSISKEALVEEWTPVEQRIATSLGYYALYDPESDRKFSIYHGVLTQIEPIVRTTEAGGIYKTSQLYLPIDGSASAELQFPPKEINYELLDHYLSDDLMYNIDEALYNSESLTESIRNLGKINMKKAIALFVDDDVRDSLNEYVNRALDIKKEILYEISGATYVEYEDDDGDTLTYRVNPKVPTVGRINGVGVDVDSGRFRLVASMPFDDDSTQYVSYRINSRLNIKRMPAFTFNTTAKLRVQ